MGSARQACSLVPHQRSWLSALGPSTALWLFPQHDFQARLVETSRTSPHLTTRSKRQCYILPFEHANRNTFSWCVQTCKCVSVYKSLNMTAALPETSSCRHNLTYKSMHVGTNPKSMKTFCPSAYQFLLELLPEQPKILTCHFLRPWPSSASLWSGDGNHGPV